jgi:hypothetical protein
MVAANDTSSYSSRTADDVCAATATLRSTVGMRGIDPVSGDDR